MSIRYERQGLRVVRMPTGPPEAAAQTLEVAVREDLRDAQALLRTAAANVRQLARLARARKTHLLPRADRDGRRKLAAEKGIDGPGIVRARVQAGLSQRDLGRQLAYSRGLVAECEKGRRNPPPRLTEWAAGVLRTKGG